MKRTTSAISKVPDKECFPKGARTRLRDAFITSFEQNPMHYVPGKIPSCCSWDLENNQRLCLAGDVYPVDIT